MDFVRLFKQAAHEAQHEIASVAHLFNPKNQQQTPSNIHQPPLAGRPTYPLPLDPGASNPEFANPQEISSRPLAKAVFAPANKTTQAQVDRASSTFSFMPKFKEIIDAAQPAVIPDSRAGLPSDGGLKGGAMAAGQYFPGQATNAGNNQAIKLASGWGSREPVVTHEALHAAFQQEPNVPKQFAKAFKGGANADIKQYLDYRLQGYTAYKGLKSLDNYDKLSPDVQTEIHSFLSEYPFFNDGKNKLPPKLQKYYGQFINANDAPKKFQDRNVAGRSAQQLLGEVPYLGNKAFLNNE